MSTSTAEHPRITLLRTLRDPYDTRPRTLEEWDELQQHYVHCERPDCQGRRRPHDDCLACEQYFRYSRTMEDMFSALAKQLTDSEFDEFLDKIKQKRIKE